MGHRVLFAAWALAWAGCTANPSTGTPPAGASVGPKADGYQSERWSAHLRDRSSIVGTIANGTVTLTYAADPEFVVLELQAARGDYVHVSAEPIDGGDPVLWLLAPDYAILAKNDDASSFGVESHVYHRAESDGRLLVAVADAYRDPAVFDVTLGGTSSPDPSDLAAFLALSPEQKMSTLYRNYRPGVRYETLDPAAGFSRAPLRLAAELESPARERLLTAYFDLRDASRAVGGTAPDVSSLLKGGLIYAVEMAVVENNEDQEWDLTRVFDANGEAIGEYGRYGLPR